MRVDQEIIKLAAAQPETRCHWCNDDDDDDNNVDDDDGDDDGDGDDDDDDVQLPR